MSFYTATVWVHVLCACVWVGGMAFLVLVAVPGLRGVEPRERARLIEGLGVRFRTVGWVCLGLLVATGTLSLYLRGLGPSVWLNPAFWAARFGRTLAIKLGLVAGILALEVHHDFWAGPRATRLLQEDPESPEATTARKKARLHGRFSLVVALAVVALAVLLVRGG